MQKAARHPPKDGVRQTSFLQLQAVNGGHAVVHGQEGHGTVGADKPPFIPIADDFADKLAVVLSLDVDPVGHSLSLPYLVVWAGQLPHIMGFPHRGCT